MTTAADFRTEQRRVALNMVAALLIAIVVLGSVALSDRHAAIPSFATRLQSAIRLDLVVIVWLAAAIGNVARLRFLSQVDIAGSAGGKGSDRVGQATAILQNTLEQTGLAIVTHLMVAATFGRSTALITALVVLFGIGRLSFWIGYARGAAGRAFGFALTFYPSLLALIASAVTLAMGGGV